MRACMNVFMCVEEADWHREKLEGSYNIYDRSFETEKN